ncbi:tetraacyldisaccharide 4'-kinase [Alicycliphilus denitrificans]|uniref:tetraacyldisaccharide 4'-kinase n=1 Tax=Alicycliphilus denitrificans TaxID=179636 RepID=UPI00095AB9C0|nr:tetraacyldisaccharide 4'-kinase [Alicycliphilus denitrificans]MBN9572919.1 tetraacyldisaccharide 4'-kinase [Alicycliphilus denitrificans]OJW91136.1 MAG: tetraacyldisaccharide 4'-kinase [Alicycliphilus sp. 69-12]BCN39372.1 tetraacyldisaccharide 4'-kinase [Alicycliphilus denitrificans]
MAAHAARLRQAWRRRGPLAMALWPLSLLYGALSALRRALYRARLLRSERLPVPVVVVGNVIAGGAGKTPATLAVVRHLRAAGWRPGVVSRGYGRATTDCREVLPTASAAEAGDEPLLIARAAGVPVFVARRRADAGRALLAAHPATDIIVCDDGLQHLALARDVEVCVFNDEGLGNGWLLPAGPLREPWPRAVDLVLHAGPAPGGPAPQFALSRALADHAVDAAGRQVPLAQLRGEPLHALAAIARPQDFFALLHAEGLRPIAEEALPDHYDFSSWKRPPDKRLRLICTEKDAVKLWPAHPDALAVPLRLSIAPAFFDALDGTLASLSSPPH